MSSIQAPASLVPMSPEIAAEVRGWFEHSEVRRWLGGPGWLERQLGVGVSAEPFRGVRVLRVHWWALLTEQDGRRVPVAVAGGDVYDRWHRDTSRPGPVFGLAYLADPDRWRQGWGGAVLRACLEHPALADVRLVTLGVDAANTASRRCAESVGFALQVPAPDHDGDVTYLWERPSRPSSRVRAHGANGGTRPASSRPPHGSR